MLLSTTKRDSETVAACVCNVHGPFENPGPKGPQPSLFRTVPLPDHHPCCLVLGEGLGEGWMVLPKVALFGDFPCQNLGKNPPKKYLHGGYWHKYCWVYALFTLLFYLPFPIHAGGANVTIKGPAPRIAAKILSDTLQLKIEQFKA